MKHPWAVGTLSAVCLSLFLLSAASGQQGLQQQQQWQGPLPPVSLVQSQNSGDSSQRLMAPRTQPVVPNELQHSPTSNAQETPQSHQALESADQTSERPREQEIPAVWPQPQPVANEQTVANPSERSVNMPGYLGLSSRDFYRQRFCMHALTIQGVEVVAVAPGGPAERAGLHPARGLSAREVATATVAGLLTLSPAALLAPSVVQAAGGVDHGDIILAVNGKRVKTQTEFQRELVPFGPQSVVYLTVRRGEAVLQIPVRMDNWPTPARVAYLQ